MSGALGGTALEAFWFGKSFLFASTVLQPTVVSVGKIYGRKLLVSVVRFLCHQLSGCESLGFKTSRGV